MAMMVFKSHKMADNGEEDWSSLNCHRLNSFGSPFGKAVGTSSNIFPYFRKSSENRRKFSEILVMARRKSHAFGWHVYDCIFIIIPCFINSCFITPCQEP